MLVIPEVAELMQRQLAKAGRKVQIGGDSPDETEQTLKDVTAWLVINSMRTERVQFDQLCHQNLANIWRQNAFTQLIEGHCHFKAGPSTDLHTLLHAAFTCAPYLASSAKQVKPEAATGFVLDMLGEAFISNRDGSVSRAKLEGKIVGIYFESSSPNVQVSCVTRRARVRTRRRSPSCSLSLVTAPQGPAQAACQRRGWRRL